MDFGKILEDWEKIEEQNGGADPSERQHWSKALSKYDASDPLGSDSLGEDHRDHSPKYKKKVTLHVKRKHPIQDEIDLHGLNAKEAEDLLMGFITESKKIGYRKVKVIHGRGLHSEKDAVLKPLVHSWLDQKKYFWELCPSDQGGSGATWIWLLTD